MNFQKKLENDYRELFTEKLKENNEFGVDLWTSLANVSWFNKADKENTDCGLSFRGAGGMIAEMLGEGDYMDWYCCGVDGVVSEYIATEMATRGWRYEAEESELFTPDDVEKLW